MIPPNEMNCKQALTELNLAGNKIDGLSNINTSPCIDFTAANTAPYIFLYTVFLTWGYLQMNIKISIISMNL